MKKSKHMHLWVNLIIVLVAFLYFAINNVNLNPLYFEGAFFWCLVITAFSASWIAFKFKELIPKVVSDENGGNPHIEKGEPIPKKFKIILFTPWVLLILIMVLSSPIINWGAYRDQLGEPEIKTFSSDMQAMDIDQIPIVDKALALKLADKKLGEKPSLGSQVYLGEPTIQRVDGKLLWAVPLHHSGFFKWITNLEGSAGYITVSATDVNDVHYVDNYKIKYQPNSYFFHDLERYLRFTGAAFDGITDYSFELDDEGQPYWVVTTYRNLRGFNLPEATGVITVNATTGEKTKYKLTDVPEWVDRVQPEGFIVNQIYNQGEYVHGIFNFSDKDKFKPSRGTAIVYNNDRCYLFTGLTSVGQDESAIGFMMIDMVTKQPILYQMNGATEYSAQKSAEGKVQHLEYTASSPIILNVDNNATYFMPLKDREGLIKQYAFVSVVNYSSVGVGETITAALNDYEKVLRNDTFSSSQFHKPEEEKELEGIVKRISAEFNGSETVYKLLIEGHTDKIFVIGSSVSDDLALTREGDRISLKYSDIDSDVLPVHSFNNKEFTK